jgi:hypothetical protein
MSFGCLQVIQLPNIHWLNSRNIQHGQLGIVRNLRSFEPRFHFAHTGCRNLSESAEYTATIIRLIKFQYHDFHWKFTGDFITLKYVRFE